MIIKKGFASDNNSGIHPEVMAEIGRVNTGHVVGYGDDAYTKEATKLFHDNFGEEAEVYMVFTGTGANVLGITAASLAFNSIICPETAHIQEDECGAPEKFSGCKLLPVKAPHGKITIEGIKKHLYHIGFEHHSQPKIVSVSQATEMGTVYTVDEISGIARFVHENEMLLHMDGARLANAAVHLNCSLKDISKDAGVDILSFGGTKNGLMCGESVIFFRPGLSENFKYIRKQGMQLASKMRFISAQFIAYFSGELWRRNAVHANDMAAYLYKSIKDFPEVEITQPVQSNGVFARLPKEIIKNLQQKFFFYDWNEEAGEVRWMTSFDTTREDIENFVSLLKSELHNLSSSPSI